MSIFHYFPQTKYTLHICISKYVDTTIYLSNGATIHKQSAIIQYNRRTKYVMNECHVTHVLCPLYLLEIENARRDIHSYSYNTVARFSVVFSLVISEALCFFFTPAKSVRIAERQTRQVTFIVFKSYHRRAKITFNCPRAYRIQQQIPCYRESDDNFDFLLAQILL